MAGLVGLAAFLMACSDDGIDGPIDTAEECKTAGGRPVYGTGPAAACDAGEQSIGSIPGTYGGGLCCRAK